MANIMREKRKQTMLLAQTRLCRKYLPVLLGLTAQAQAQDQSGTWWCHGVDRHTKWRRYKAKYFKNVVIPPPRCKKWTSPGKSGYMIILLKSTRCLTDIDLVSNGSTIGQQCSRVNNAHRDFLKTSLIWKIPHWQKRSI